MKSLNCDHESDITVYFGYFRLQEESTEDSDLLMPSQTTLESR